jgi:hypothetical protein
MAWLAVLSLFVHSIGPSKSRSVGAWSDGGLTVWLLRPTHGSAERAPQPWARVRNRSAVSPEVLTCSCRRALSPHETGEIVKWPSGVDLIATAVVVTAASSRLGLYFVDGTSSPAGLTLLLSELESQCRCAL